MSPLPFPVAVGAVSVALVGSAVWAGLLSGRSALRGPEWALGHARRSVPLLLIVAGLGLVAAVALRPAWVGLTVTYVGALLAWVERSLARTLGRVQQAGGFVPLEPARREAVVGRTIRWLLGAAALVAAVGVLDLGWRGPVAWLDFALALWLVAGALMVRREAARHLRAP